MKIASVAEVKAHFSAFLKASEKGPVIVTRNGKPAAVLLSVEDEDEIERLILAYSQVPEDIKYSEATDSGDRWYSTRSFWREVEMENASD